MQQKFRSMLTGITYFCVILLIVLVIAGYYKVDIDSKLAALLNTSLGLRFGQVRHSKDCNTVWQIEGIFLIYLSFVAVCLTFVGNIKSVFLHFHLDFEIVFCVMKFGCARDIHWKVKKIFNKYISLQSDGRSRPNTATILNILSVLQLQLVCHRNDYCTVWIDPFFSYLFHHLWLCVTDCYREFQSKFFDTFIWTFKWRSSRWNSAVLCSGYMLKGRKISNKYISLWSNSRSGPNSNKSSSFDKILGSFKVAIISCGFEASWGCLIRSNSGCSLTWDIKGFEIVVDNGVIKSVLPISFFSISELTTSWILVALALCCIVCLCTLPKAGRRFLDSMSIERGA